ncbi:MAG: M20/M25/M40 family metallo-hydrolase [Oscillospiraceae bacterium]|nr:M20/M25/M40 family metallo-hydrolase [Oscillospiraceae bacterium]
MIKGYIDRIFSEHVELLKSFAAIPAPSGQEDLRAQFIMVRLSEMGVDDAYIDSAKNVIVPMGAGEGGVTVFSAHTDVVFPDTDILPVFEKDGWLHAPGVGDDTANAAALLTIIRYIKENGLEPRAPLMFVFDSCEEGLGNLKGVRTLMSDHAGRIKELVSFDCNFEEGIVTGAVGSERWRLTAKTRGGHSFNDFGTPSAIHRIAELVSALYKQEIPDVPGARTTYNAGVITGGTSINTIAESAELLYEYRSDDRRALAAMREGLMTLVSAADCPEARLTAELIGERPCMGEVDPAAMDELIERCSRSIERVLGKKPARRAASTDANIPLSMGVPAVTFGLFNGCGEHTREEKLEISSLKKGLEIALRLVTESCFR